MKDDNVERRPADPPPSRPEVPRSTEAHGERVRPRPASDDGAPGGTQAGAHRDSAAAAKSEFDKAGTRPPRDLGLPPGGPGDGLRLSPGMQQVHKEFQERKAARQANENT